jgi:hypothetical protein
MIPTVYFYAPDEAQQKNIQQDHRQWTGFHSNFTAWISQTYFYLKQAGFSCEVAHTIPEQGILIADRDTLDNDYPFLENVMLICVQSDKEYHPSAHLHIVYNPVRWEKTKNSIWNPHLISHWPMPGIIPRSSERKQLVQNISYIGTRSQLASELKSDIWKQDVEALSCQWQPIWDHSQWHNYHDLDVIVAARSFDDRVYPNKGSIKLINAWRAGVPAILTPELGFMNERKSELDFWVVRSYQEVLRAVSYLQNNPSHYQKMIENGLERAKEHTMDITLNQWLDFFHHVAFPTYEKWEKMSQLEKRWLFNQRFFYFKISRAKNKLSCLTKVYL